MIKNLLHLVGLELTPTNHADKLISGVGGFVAIAAITLITHWLCGPDALMPVVASMGASSVLLFANPHGQLSQPWPLAMGHLLSALSGVMCARLIPDPIWAGAAAVGLAITAMYYARCIHPPGGATALTAVLRASVVGKLGFGYVLMPVGLNVLILLVVAVLFNWPYEWRRYPAGLLKRRLHTGHRVTREDWTHALREIGSMADITEDELIELYDRAIRHHRANRRVKN
jgi:CBS-domain-containing membrane protein